MTSTHNPAARFISKHRHRVATILAVILYGALLVFFWRAFEL